MQNLSLTDSMSNSDTDTCRSMGMLPRAKQPTPNGIPGPHYNPRQDFDSELTTRSLMFFLKTIHVKNRLLYQSAKINSSYDRIR